MEVTLLEENQIFGDNRLEIFNKYGIKAVITDFSILLGGYFYHGYHVNEKNSLEAGTGYYWTKTNDGYNCVLVVDENGDFRWNAIDERDVGIRPVLPYSSISSISTNIVSRKTKNNILKIEYGYYPQTAVSKNMQEKLENIFQKGNILSTGNIYTTDSRKTDDWENGFEKQEYKEYEYKGKRYIRVIANSCYNFNKLLLSNGGLYKNGDVVWVEVEPLKWLVDKQSDLMITKEIVLAGIQFQYNKLENSEFEDTDMYKFLNTYFVKDIMQSINRKLEVKVEYEKSKQELELENIEKAKQKILNLKKKY